MAVSLPTTFCLSHGDECCNRSATKSSFPRHHHMVMKRNLIESSTVGRSVVTAATEGSKKAKESQPSWTELDSDEPPPWARNEGLSTSTSQESFEVPFYVYLLASAITAIAAIGSVFEYSSKNPVFGVLDSDSIFYAPVLGFFAFTGIPTSIFLWFKSVKAANKEAEEQDKRDGFR